ncbi:Rrf2 family transcriptional regulator [Desulfocucumis palustris]|uniref:Rrf2 family transcriptional regulator n=1 Tax=Desulfocucumis palustris TaxID=1898651 RepID=A0A2L2XFB5_9FIRM|nr:Rrf2 family transcriptional regulator [Desulfocucumis palustris]GBF35037.1 Rrf2 family transcriptional regulator [Desulfocucumis palustris]
MRLNQATDYAMRSVLYLSGLPYGQVVEAKLISEEERVPMRFLLKILRQLTQAGIVQSYRGINGGYSLARPPSEITMLDVVEAIEGPIAVNRCLHSPDECNKFFSAHCPVHQALYELQQGMKEHLSRYNFQMLKERVK